MVRQYIGARYVPKFTGDWDETLTYEPLCIVKVGNNFYTSKIPVPAGTPVTNTAYWVLTGNLNGSIVDLEERMAAVEARYPRRKYYMPEMFGGRPDDPSVDNSPAIRQCIDAAEENEGVILLSAGIYYCETPIQISYKPHCIEWYGTGNSQNGEASGTVLYYTGYGDFITFTDGYWYGIFENLSFKTKNTGTSCIKFTDDSATGSRAHKVKFENVGFYFRSIGAWVGVAAYVIFDNCDFRGDSDNRDVNRIGLYLGGLEDRTSQDIEYISLNNCRFSMHASSAENENLNSVGILMDRGTHVTLYHVDITDCDKGIYLDCLQQIGFFDTYSCDWARCHEAISVNITQSLVESTHYSPTFTGTNAETDRLLKVTKASGVGGAYAARIRFISYSVRGSFPGIWFEATPATALYPGACEFIDGSGNEVLQKYAVDQPRLASLGTTSATNDHITGDFNDYTHSGFFRYNLRTGSTNGPGFDCFLIVFASNAWITQIAIGTGNDGLAKRSYNRTTNVWTAWKQCSFT